MKEFGSSKRIPEFLTTGQVAAFCGVNFRTVIRWIKKGLLQAQRLPGRGDHRVSRSQFLEFLERNQLAVPEAFQTERNSTREIPVVADSSRKRILIVDDDEVTASAIQRVLTLQGYETKSAKDGFEAGRLIESFVPSLITLDLMMWGIDGISVLKALKTENRFRDLKVVVVSADTDAKIRQALDLGASKALKKPFTNKELISTVAELLGDTKTKSSST